MGTVRLIQVDFKWELLVNVEEQAKHDWNRSVISGDILQFEFLNFQDRMYTCASPLSTFSADGYALRGTHAERESPWLVDGRNVLPGLWLKPWELYAHNADFHDDVTHVLQLLPRAEHNDLGFAIIEL